MATLETTVPLVALAKTFQLGSVNLLEPPTRVVAVVVALVTPLELVALAGLAEVATVEEHLLLLNQVLPTLVVAVALVCEVVLETVVVLVVQESCMFVSRYKEKQCRNILHN
jgi:hypothetical protein